MQRPHELSPQSLLSQAYCAAFAVHGDLELTIEVYTDHLTSIQRKHLGENLLARDAVDFLERLHTTDLYLSVACTQGSESAWNRFIYLYRKRILEAARPVPASRTRDEAQDLADSLIGRLFLPDSSGRSRIASYDRRSSLITWLTTIVSHTATKERERKFNNSLRLDELSEIPDHSVLQGIDRRLHTSSYVRLIEGPLSIASQSLTEREKVILALPYQDGLNKADIARILLLHPSNVTRQLQQIHQKLRARILLILESTHRLSSDVIEACLTDVDLLENCEHSFLNSLALDD